MKRYRPKILHLAGIGILLISIGTLIPSPSIAQPRAKATLDTHTIRIGEQPTLTLSLQYLKKEGQNDISFPRIGDTLSKHIEVLERSSIDTLVPSPEKAPKLRRSVQRIRITSFDSGQHRIPPLHFRVNEDSISTEPILLRVGSVDLSQRKGPYPIKGVQPTPYPWSVWFKDHWPWFAVAGGVLAIALILFLYFRNRKQKGESVPETPKTPPHERAFERLEKLKAEEAWKEWEVKTYYTELTDTVRHYLEERYRIPALEETTPKILNELSFTDIDEEGKGRVRKLLRTADMVKFAKQRPDTSERERSLEEAIAFVQRSSPKPEEEKGEEG